MKKFFCSVFFLSVLFVSSVSGFTLSDLQIFTLENGLTLYFLQDTTTATVRMELNIKAGTTYQNPDDTGYVQLYAKLSGLELTPDCVKTEKTVTPAQVEKTLVSFAEYFRPLQVSDKKLKSEVSLYKEQLKEFSSSAAGFINGAIDCKVFEETPWKQESGVIPTVFNGKNNEQIRTKLNQIQQRLYLPKNACLYISGNITDSTALSLTEKYFGKASQIFTGISNANPDNSKKIELKTSSQRKFVITGEDLSDDLTQIVVQYTDFTQDQADLLSAVFNNSGSTFKQLLLKQKNLAIRAPDYIDASSAQQNNSSRLVIQAICEKTKATAAVQSELFLQMAAEKNRLTQGEVDYAIKNLNSVFNTVSDNSTLLMKNLAVFNQTNKDYSETIFNKNSRLQSINIDELNLKYENSKPYVFVLCSTQAYKRASKEFKKYGYTLLTEKNSSWYTQERYRHLIHTEKNTTAKNADTDLAFSAKRFIDVNKEQFSTLTLQNNIPVTIKTTAGSKTVSAALAIDGGELLFADKEPGLCSILVNSLAAVIQWQLDQQFAEGIIKTAPTVTAWTGAQYSLLTINCSASEVTQCIKTAAASIIFGDITPALADGISYDLRTQWRIKTGTPDFQLLCEAVRLIYGKPFANLYNDTKDKPVQMEFTEIAAAYPLILDSTRFSLVLTGGIELTDDLTAVLNESFGVLGTVKATETIKTKVEKKSLPSKIRKIQLRHQFFTDIAADKAGPRPAVLIPTTDFSDPLLYILESPDINSTDCALFNALLYNLGERLQKKISSEQSVKVTAPDSDLPYGQIVVTKIKHTTQTDSLFKECVQELLAELSVLINTEKENVIDLEKPAVLENLENAWVLRELEKTGDNQGTAFLIQKGKTAGNPSLYLDQYKAVSTAQAEDYYIVAKTYLPEVPALRIYSVDSKK